MTAVIGILLGGLLFALFGILRSGERRSPGCCRGGAVDAGCMACPSVAPSEIASLEPESEHDRPD